MSNVNVLGIDVSKNELVIFNSENDSIISVPNTVAGLNQAVKKQNWLPDNYVIGLESTGDYSFLAMKFFVEKNFKVKLLNPIVTKKFINATIRKKKTDKSDAQAIAMIVQHGDGRLITQKDFDLAKKTQLRTERKIISIKADLKKLQQSLEKKISNGVNVESTLNEIKNLVAAVEETSKKIMKQAMSEDVDRQEEIIRSHVGCGEKLSAIISAEAGDLKRFPSAKQFKAYVGIDPKIIQSGQMDIKGKMTKRGNPVLRQALFLAAFVASKHDPELKIYYEKKRAEGKHHTHAVCTVARKMCERIYSTVTQNRLYQPNYPQAAS